MAIERKCQYECHLGEVNACAPSAKLNARGPFIPSTAMDRLLPPKLRKCKIPTAEPIKKKGSKKMSEENVDDFFLPGGIFDSLGNDDAGFSSFSDLSGRRVKSKLSRLFIGRSAESDEGRKSPHPVVSSKLGTNLYAR
jgi:hypothetical protein